MPAFLDCCLIADEGLGEVGGWVCGPEVFKAHEQAGEGCSVFCWPPSGCHVQVNLHHHNLIPGEVFVADDILYGFHCFDLLKGDCSSRGHEEAVAIVYSGEGYFACLCDALACKVPQFNIFHVFHFVQRKFRGEREYPVLNGGVGVKVREVGLFLRRRGCVKVSALWVLSHCGRRWWCGQPLTIDLWIPHQLHSVNGIFLRAIETGLYSIYCCCELFEVPGWRRRDLCHFCTLFSYGECFAERDWKWSQIQVWLAQSCNEQ